MSSNMFECLQIYFQNFTYYNLCNCCPTFTNVTMLMNRFRNLSNFDFLVNLHYYQHILDSLEISQGTFL